MEQAWPSSCKGYKLQNPCGMGAFGLVWQAKVLEGNFIGSEVAIKIIELEQFPDHTIDEIRKEIQIMSTCEHKNIVKYHVSFVDATQLWLVMPILSMGSLSDVIKSKFPDGIKDQAIIATILKEVLEGLKYFHNNGQMHRDIKCGNILLDQNGGVFLGDFGVAAHLKKGQKRKTFVGSPCWMAPEVMEQVGYDFAADIWSLGITCIEMCEGSAPNSELPAMKIILYIMNQDPPQLSKFEDWDQTFRDFVSSCLKKVPQQRQTTESLLKSKFLSKAKDSAYLKEHLVGEIPTITSRVDQGLIALGEDFLQKLQVKSQIQKQPSKKWDFGSSDQDPREPDCKKAVVKKQSVAQLQLNGDQDDQEVDDDEFGLGGAEF